MLKAIKDLGPVLKAIKELDAQVRANTTNVDDLNGKVEQLQTHGVRLTPQQQQLLLPMSMYAPPLPFGMVYPPPPQPTLPPVHHAEGNGSGKQRAGKQEPRGGSKKNRSQRAEDKEEEEEDDVHPKGCKCRACKHVPGCKCDECE